MNMFANEAYQEKKSIATVKQRKLSYNLGSAFSTECLVPFDIKILLEIIII